MNNQNLSLTPGQQPQVISSDIDTPQLIEEWKRSKNYVEQYTNDFKSLDQIVDGVPLNPVKGVPFVGDTTLAGLVRAIPRSSLQQLPTFQAVVNGTKNSIPALICTFLLKKVMFNEDTFGKGLLSTLQIGMEQALTHGYAPFFVRTGVMYDDFGTSLGLLHYSDTSPEPGISDSNESGYHYVVSNLPKSRVKQILNSALKNPNTSWNVAALQQLLETDPSPTNYSQWESTPRQNAAGENSAPKYKIVTRYETGVGGTVITFCPDQPNAPLRVFQTKSKFGYPRVQYLVIDPAALTPFGISRVRLASPNQNLMNVYLGSIAAMLLLNAAPPVLKKGIFLNQVNLRQKEVWETIDTNADVQIKSMDNGSLSQFTPMSQQLTGQIQNIMGNPQPTPQGNNNFSKTAPGVQLQQQTIDVSTNQITKIGENFLRQYALSGLDTIISEQEGEDDLIVDDETKDAINQLGQNNFVPENNPITGQPSVYVPIIGDDNKIHIVWEDFYNGEADPQTGERTGGIEQWSVDISQSISQDQLDQQKRADLQNLLTTYLQTNPQSPMIPVLESRLTNDIDPTIKAPAAQVQPPTIQPPAQPEVPQEQMPQPQQ